MLDKITTRSEDQSSCDTGNNVDTQENDKIESEVTDKINNTVNNEIIITKEVINIDADKIETTIKNSCTDENNIKNASLTTNGAVSEITAKDLYIIGNCDL